MDKPGFTNIETPESNTVLSIEDSGVFDPDAKNAFGIETRGNELAQLPTIELVDGRENSPSLSQEANLLIEHAREVLEPSKFKHFQENLQSFEHRMSEHPEEITETYKHLNRVFNGRRNAVIEPEDVPKLVFDVISQAAYPRSIKQGAANTCAFASLESRMYAKHPSKAAKLVVDAALNGKVVDSNGRVIELDKESINYYPDSHGDFTSLSTRSHASQIFQFSAVNVFHENLPDRFKNYDYLIRPGENGGISEKTIDRTTGNEYNFPGATVVDGDKLEHLYKDLTGENEPSFVIDISRARTPQEFQDTLKRLKENGSYPAILITKATNPPFNSGGTPYHVVAIEESADLDKLLVNDQYGPERDIEVDKTTLFNSMRHSRVLDRATIALEAAADQYINIEQLLKEHPERKTEYVQELFEFGIHEFSAKQLRTIENAYLKKTGRHLQDFLAEHLSDSDMNARGYYYLPVIGWK